MTIFINQMEGNGTFVVEFEMWATIRMPTQCPGTLSVVVSSRATYASGKARVDTLEVRLSRVLGVIHPY